MSVGKRPSLPAILSANSLLDGDVVYRAADRWSPHLADALVARDAATAAELEAALAAAERSGDPLGPALIPVALDADGRVVPNHYRERIRALGPTIRPDLGPQARGEHRHVSL